MAYGLFISAWWPAGHIQPRPLLARSAKLFVTGYNELIYFLYFVSLKIAILILSAALHTRTTHLPTLKPYRNM